MTTATAPELASDEGATAVITHRVRDETDDDFFVSSGPDFWFAPKVAKARIPIQWKQYLVTWSAIYPLVLGVPMIVLPLLRNLGVPPNRYTDTACISALIVFLMVYVVMPR